MANSQASIDHLARQLSLPFMELKTFNLSAGSLRRTEAVQEALKITLKNCPLSREEIADELSRMLSEKITVSHINNWVAESKNGWRMPLEYAAAFSTITNDIRAIKEAFEGSGITILNDREMVFYEIGKAEEEKREMAVKLKENRNRLKRLKLQGKL